MLKLVDVHIAVSRVAGEIERRGASDDFVSQWRGKLKHLGATLRRELDTPDLSDPRLTNRILGPFGEREFKILTDWLILREVRSVQGVT